MGAQKSFFVAIGSRLKGIPEVLTLGVKPNFQDYTQAEKGVLFNAPFVLYPTLNYAQFLSTMGKKIFPSLETYLYADEKIKQTTLFYMAEIPHPRTRIYYTLHRKDILNDFRFPFIGKIPRSSARGRGVFRIQNNEELERYLNLTKIAYIQEFLPHERDLRVVIIHDEPVLAYWRISMPGDFRTNLSQGGEIDFDHIPDEGVKAALEAARKCRFNDVGMDLICSGNRWFVIEANMKYGRKALKMKGFDLKQVLRERLLSGKIAASCGKK